MERTLMTGDRIIVSVWDREDVKRGDVVVFEDPDNWLPQLQRSGVKGAAVTAPGICAPAAKKFRQAPN